MGSVTTAGSDSKGSVIGELERESKERCDGEDALERDEGEVGEE